jgi:hypothetical protein
MSRRKSRGREAVCDGDRGKGGMLSGYLVVDMLEVFVLGGWMLKWKDSCLKSKYVC